MRNSGSETGVPENSFDSSVEKSIYTALEHYSNVHRGSGHFSAITTCLYDEARKIILDYLGLNDTYTVIFCSSLRAAELTSKLHPDNIIMISSEAVGMNTGIRAVAVKKKRLSGIIPFQTGGGTTKLVSSDRIAWADAPGRFEAGTPAIINVIAFARALQFSKETGNRISEEKVSKDEGNAQSTEVQDEINNLTGSLLLDKLKDAVIGRNITVPVRNGFATYINLDYAASTPALLPVFKAYCRALHSGSTSNIEVINRTKAIISQMLNAPIEKYDIVFTSNTTESINILAEGTSGSVLVSILEHNSDDLPWRARHTMMRFPVDKDGFVNQAELEKILASNPQIKIFALSGASNVIGSCNDITGINSVAHRYGVRVLIDAAQLVAHRKIDMNSSATDFLVFSGHKAYAPFGTGVLIARKGLINFSDEKWNEIRSSGEENVAGIAALGESLILLNKTGMDLIMKEEQSLLSKFIEGLSEIDGVQIFGINDPGRLDKRLGVISFFIKKVWPDKIAKGLAEEGIGIRYGCHCAHILVKHLLHVGPSLEKFQFIIAKLFKKVNFPGVARISLGIGTTDDDIASCINAIKEMSDGKKHTVDDFKTRMMQYGESVKAKVFGNIYS